MRILSTTGDSKRTKKGCVLTIGNFDGVHVGHQEILRISRKLARDRVTDMVVITFEPHPVTVLYPEKAQGVLSPLPLRLDLLRRYAHAGCIVVLESDKQFLTMSPEEFIDELLMQQLQPSVIVEGDDFHFGARREGDIEALKKLGGGRGFEVVVVPARQITLSTGQLIRVSSTMIRYMIESGHVGDAMVALSRSYRLMGRVISGKGRGRQLGFPTVNMQKPEQIIPAEGVYSGFAETAESEQQLLGKTEKIPAVFSIGQARTFGDEHPLLIEAHFLINNVGDMANKWVAMDFVQHLRSQHKFNSPGELAQQIARDCESARESLETALPESGL